jgi:hypothetical protein
VSRRGGVVRLLRWYEQTLDTRWRSALQREARRQEDAFVAVLFLAAFGVDDPAGLATLELTPELVESFHRFHQQQGLDRFPEPGFCC